MHGVGIDGLAFCLGMLGVFMKKMKGGWWAFWWTNYMDSILVLDVWKLNSSALDNNAHDRLSLHWENNMASRSEKLKNKSNLTNTVM